MKKLIVLTVFVFTGMLVNSAMAAGPFKSKDQLVTSPIIPGNSINCLALNNSNDPLEILVSLYDAAGNLRQDDTRTPDPGTGAGFRITGATLGSGYCTFEWFGSARDFILSICAADALIVGGTGSTSCLNVY